MEATTGARPSGPAFGPALATPAKLVVRMADVSAHYPGRPEPALKGVSLEVPAGERVGLVGPNGSGKSTLLKSLVDLLPVTGGVVEVFGGRFARARKRVAYLPQVTEIDWRFPVTVRRLVLGGRYVHLGWLRRPTRRDQDLVNRALDRLGIAHLADRQIGQLSGGQRQRALVARAYIQEADLLLLDEPLNAVDAESQAVILDIFDELKARGASAIIATHALEFGADQVVYLSEGRRVSEPDTTHSAHTESPWTS